MTTYNTIFDAPPSGGNFLVGDTMRCPATSPVSQWTYCGADVWAPTPALIKKFQTWPTNVGLLLASLVTSSTASRTAGVVTITATAHGVTTGTTFVGYRFYYPGSPSLVAGWYDSILTIPDANTITFSAAGADFGSESINSGAAWTTATDIISAVIPGGVLKDGSKISCVSLRAGDSTAVTKTIGFCLNGTVLQTNGLTSSPVVESRQGFRCLGLNKQIGMAGQMEGTVTAAFNTQTRDLSVDQTVAVRGTISAASGFLVLFSAHLEIIS